MNEDEKKAHLHVIQAEIDRMYPICKVCDGRYSADSGSWRGCCSKECARVAYAAGLDLPLPKSIAETNQ